MKVNQVSEILQQEFLNILKTNSLSRESISASGVPFFMQVEMNLAQCLLSLKAFATMEQLASLQTVVTEISGIKAVSIPA